MSPLLSVQTDRHKTDKWNSMSCFALGSARQLLCQLLPLPNILATLLARVLWMGFSTTYQAKMNGFKPNLVGRNYVIKGTHRKIWAPIAGVNTFIVCLCIASPLGTSEWKRPPISASNYVILLLVYRYSHVKIGFLHVRGGGSKKWDFLGFGGDRVAFTGLKAIHRLARKERGLLAER